MDEANDDGNDAADGAMHADELQRSVQRALGDALDGGTWTRDRAREVMGAWMDGLVSPVVGSAILASLRTRGETVDEIVGFAEAMRARALPIDVPRDVPVVDLCGTGGTGLATINVSTTAAFVAAAGGAVVVKHGNRGVTKASGSADMLEALGVRLDVDHGTLADAVRETGIAFAFARSHHPAMRHVAPVRAELRARTVFNVLGPLTNPAGATRQLLGTFRSDVTGTLALVLRDLGAERALVVHGSGLDDFTVTGTTHVHELSATGEVRGYDVTPEDVGLVRADVRDLAGGDPDTNARLTRAILAGQERGARRDVVAFNAGAALYLADLAADLAEGVRRAIDILDSGAALDVLDRYAAATVRGA